MAPVLEDTPGKITYISFRRKKTINGKYDAKLLDKFEDDLKKKKASFGQ